MPTDILHLSFEGEEQRTSLEANFLESFSWAGFVLRSKEYLGSHSFSGAFISQMEKNSANYLVCYSFSLFYDMDFPLRVWVFCPFRCVDGTCSLQNAHLKM